MENNSDSFIENVNNVAKELPTIKEVNEASKELTENLPVIIQSSASAEQIARDKVEIVAIMSEISGLKATASLLDSSQSVNAIYSKETGTLHFGIPRGLKGNTGNSYNPDKTGTLANRSLYDDQGEGFSYLATDQSPSTIYFKKTDANADWDGGSPFGQGEQGIGIKTVRLKANTDDIVEFVLEDDSVAGEFTLTKELFGLGNVDNTADEDKPVSIATAIELAKKVDKTSVATFNDQSLLDGGNIEINPVQAYGRTGMVMGGISLSAITATLIYDAKAYTGNGTSQDLDYGINLCDFTQSGNGSGYWLDRTTKEVKTDAGVVVPSGECNWLDYDATSGETPRGVGSSHIKSLSDADSNRLFDGIRGKLNVIFTNHHSAEYNEPESLLSFNNNGVSIGSNNTINDGTPHNYISYIDYFCTHIKWGTTNQGKLYVEAYNPVTNLGMIYYIGTNVTGHELPHSMNTQIKILHAKNLGGALGWIGTSPMLSSPLHYLSLNDPSGEFTSGNNYFGGKFPDENVITLGDVSHSNALDVEHILYYKCDSATRKIGTYQGTVAGNFIEVGGKPARITIKNINSAYHWWVVDNKRGADKVVYLNLPDVEGSSNITFDNDGFTLNDTNSNVNAPNTTYYYEVELDTNADGGGSIANLPSNTTQAQITDSAFIFSGGFNDNTVEEFNGTVSIPNTVWDNAGGNQYLKKVLGSPLSSAVGTTVKPVFGKISNTADYCINSIWYDPATHLPYSPQITYAQKDGYLAKFEIVNNQPADVHYDDFYPSLMQDTAQFNRFKITEEFDLGQTRVNVTNERALGVWETNNTKKPIKVLFSGYSSSTNASISFNNSDTYVINTVQGAYWTIEFTVMPDEKYKIDGALSNLTWFEIR